MLQQLRELLGRLPPRTHPIMHTRRERSAPPPRTPPVDRHDLLTRIIPEHVGRSWLVRQLPLRGLRDPIAERPRQLARTLCGLSPGATQQWVGRREQILL